MLIPQLIGEGVELGSAIASLFGHNKANDYMAEADANLNQQRVIQQQMQMDYQAEQTQRGLIAAQQTQRVMRARYQRYNLGGSVLAGTQE